MANPIENPFPHFLLGDVCIVRATSHEVVIECVDCNDCQTKDEHQWSYSVIVPKDSGIKCAWYKGEELTLIRPVTPRPHEKYQTRRDVIKFDANQLPSQSTLPVPSINLPHGAMQQIQKALSITTTQSELKDLGLTKPRAYGNFESIHDDTIYTVRDCPSRKEGLCSYLPYYGFTENYEYCEFCDDKRRMKR